MITTITLLTGFSILPTVYAHRGTQKLNFTINTICSYSANLSDVELDGSINHGSTVASIFEGVIDEVSDNTMNLKQNKKS